MLVQIIMQGYQTFFKKYFFVLCYKENQTSLCVFQKHLISLFNIWSLLIFQQLTLTAAATIMIAAAVLTVSSIRIFFICAFTKLSNIIPFLECCYRYFGVTYDPQVCNFLKMQYIFCKLTQLWYIISFGSDQQFCTRLCIYKPEHIILLNISAIWFYDNDVLTLMVKVMKPKICDPCEENCWIWK